MSTAWVLLVDLNDVLEECEAKWDSEAYSLFRDAPVGTGTDPAPPGLTRAQAVLKGHGAQEKVEVMKPDNESAEFLTTFFTESE